MLEIHLTEDVSLDAQTLEVGKLGVAVKDADNGYVKVGDVVQKLGCGIANLSRPSPTYLTDRGRYFVRPMRPGEYLKYTEQSVEVHLEESQDIDVMDLKEQEPGILTYCTTLTDWCVGEPVIKLCGRVYNLKKGFYGVDRNRHKVRRLREGEYIRFSK